MEPGVQIGGHVMRTIPLGAMHACASVCACICAQVYLAGRPADALLLLLLQELIQDWHDPVLEGAVVAVRHQHVAHTVPALLSQLCTLHVEIPYMGRT